MFSMFVFGNATFACGICSARKRLFEEARGETEVGRRLLAPEWRPLPPLALAPQTHPAGMQTESQLELAIFAGVILPETGQFLLCSLPLWQQLQRCRQTRARVPLFFIHFTSVLHNSSPLMSYFLGSKQLQASACIKKLAAGYWCQRADERFGDPPHGATMSHIYIYIYIVSWPITCLVDVDMSQWQFCCLCKVIRNY